MPCEPPLGRREAATSSRTRRSPSATRLRMMFCETAAWLFGVKGWWWQNRWVPGRSTWSPSLWNNPAQSSRRAAASATCSTAGTCPTASRAPTTPRPARRTRRCAACNRFAAHLRSGESLARRTLMSDPGDRIEGPPAAGARAEGGANGATRAAADAAGAAAAARAGAHQSDAAALILPRVQLPGAGADPEPRAGAPPQDCGARRRAAVRRRR